MALHESYLLDKKDYPSDVLGGKHLLADYKGAPSRNKKKLEAADEQGMAFAEDREADGVHPHLPRLRQEVQRRLSQVQAHHRGQQIQGGDT